MATAGDVIVSLALAVEDTSAMAGAGITVGTITATITDIGAADMTNATSIMDMATMAMGIAIMTAAADMIAAMAGITVVVTDTDSC